MNNHNLSNLGQWFRATKIPLNITKIEIVIFKPDSKQITKHIRIIINKHFTFKEYMAKLMQKLNRRNGVLAKLRHQISSDQLKTIYFALFDPLSYALCSIGIDQRNSNIAGMIQKTQNKALKIINLKEKAEPSHLFYTNHKILKLQILKLQIQ